MAQIDVFGWSRQPALIDAARVRRQPALTLACAFAAVATVLMALNVLQDLDQANLWAHAAHDKIWLLDVDGEGSFYAWLSSMALLIDGLLLAVVALGKSDGQDRFARQWWILAAGFIALSADESVGFHESLASKVSAVVDVGGALHFAWVIPALVACAGVGVFFLPFLAALPARLRTLFLVSGAFYVGGAVGMEMVSGAVYEAVRQDLLGYRMLTAGEESMEMAGALLFMFTLSSQARLGIDSRRP